MAEQLSDYARRLETAQRVRSLYRSIVYIGRDASSALTNVRQQHPGDKITPVTIQRGAVTVTDTANTPALGHTAVADVGAVIGPLSAFTGLSGLSVKASFANSASAVLVPGKVASGSGVRFVEQGSPIPIISMVFDGPILTPRKVALGVALTNELLSSSNAEDLVRQVITEQVSLGVDSIMLDATDTDGIRPAGLRFGVAAEITSGVVDAMRTDLATLASAVAPVAGSLRNIAFICSPDVAVKIALGVERFPFTLLATGGLPAGTMMAIAINALAVAASPTIRFEMSDQSAIHMEDTTPAEIGAAATPNTVAAPVRSLWQTNAKALRVIFELDWALRTTGAISWMENIAWA